MCIGRVRKKECMHKHNADDWNLRILDYRSAKRSWSKYHTLCAVAAAALALTFASPATAKAEELATDPQQPVVTVQDVQQAAPADTQQAAPVQDEQAAPAEDGKTDELAAPVAKEEVKDVATSDKAQDAADAKEEPAVDPADMNTNGVDIIFDFNQDGKTDAQDFIEYIKFAEKYTSEMSDIDDEGKFIPPINGAWAITGTTQYLINGQSDAKFDLTKLDVSKIQSYYLNNIGQATPVKNQGAFGTCWAFASISALESAILKAQAKGAGVDVDAIKADEMVKPILDNLSDHGIDLSELQLAWLGYVLQQAGSQKGEGTVPMNPGDDPNAILQMGGFTNISEVLFGAWQALANESQVPYWPMKVVTPKADLQAAFNKRLNAYKKNGNLSKVALFEQHQGDIDKYYDTWANDGFQVDDYNYFWVKFFANDFLWDRAVKDPEQIAHVTGVTYLPDPNIFKYQDNGDGTGDWLWVKHNDGAENLIKQALIEHGAVQIGYNADISLADKQGNSDYINKTNWAQYQDSEKIEVTHAVTIVGWDDNYDKNNFATGVNDVSKIKNGAWLVKNSWGSYDFYKKYGDAYTSDANWGITNDKGEHTGYFWLSYYDHTITNPSYYNVDLAADGFNDDNVYAYDFNQIGADPVFVFRTNDNKTQVANVFTANGKESLNAVSVRTSAPKSTAHIKIYLVDDGVIKGGDPTQGTLVADFTEGITASGFHTVNLPKALKLAAGQKFAVVENIVSDNVTDENGGQVSYINLETQIAKDLQTATNLGGGKPNLVCHPGETFIGITTKDGWKWMSPEELTAGFDNGGIFTFGNALIKAFTKTITPEDEINDLNDQLKQLKDELAKTQDSLKKAQDEADVNAGTIKDLTDSLAAQTKTMTDLQDKVDELNKQIAEGGKDNAELKDQLDDALSAIKDLQGQVKKLREQLENQTKPEPKPVPEPDQPEVAPEAETKTTAAPKHMAATAETPKTGDVATMLPELVAAAVAAFGIGFAKKKEEE